ncbi:MAG: hypothetical protein D3923_07730, partial [Candidatus Electrothrix sp. AR3]|nr:hypothetical protein [Candidatus Electrothrix sp. AR3]
MFALFSLRVDKTTKKMKMIKVLFLAGVVFSVLSWTVAVAGEQLLIVKVLDRQPEAKEGIVLDKLAWSVGLPPVPRHNSKSRNNPYELQVLNSQGEIVYTKSFDFIRHLEVPLPEPGDKKQDAPSRILLKEPEAVLVVPYFPEGAEVRVKGVNKKTVV